MISSSGSVSVKQTSALYKKKYGTGKFNWNNETTQSDYDLYISCVFYYPVNHSKTKYEANIRKVNYSLSGYKCKYYRICMCTELCNVKWVQLF